jgi:KDO2-lipid IV(A) lauroyltransferase
VKSAGADFKVKRLDQHAAMVGPELLKGQNQTLEGGNIDGIGQKRLQNDVAGLLYGGGKKAAIILKRQDDSETSRLHRERRQGLIPMLMRVMMPEASREIYVQIKSRLTLSFLKVLSWLPLGLARRVGRVLGLLCWHLQTRMQQTTATNLTLCFPALDDSARERLGRRSLQSTLQTIMEAGAAWLWPAHRTLALIQRVDNLALLERAKAAGNGVIVLAPHLGNWEILGLYLNACGLGQSYQLYQAPADPRLDALIHRGRSRAGATMVATGNKGVAELLRALRAGNIAGILPDQVPDAGGGEYAPFFGVPALTMTLLPRLQQKTGAAIVLAFAKRVDSGEGPGFELVFSDPDPGIYAGDMTEALAAMNRSIEALIKLAPEQYQWEYKRFRRQPEGLPRVYQA